MSYFFDLLSLQMLPGPQFLFVYAALIVACGIYMSVRIGALRRRHIQDIPPRQLRPYELAILREGPRRALNTAIVHLEAQGGLKVEEGTPARLQANPAYQSQDELENALLARAKNAATLAELNSSDEVRERLDQIQRDLQARNWMLGPGEVQRTKDHFSSLALLMCGMGFTRIWIGLLHARPVNYLFGEFLWMILTFWWFNNRIPQRPAEAEKALEEEVRKGSALSLSARTNPGALSGADGALAVALFGVAPLIATLMPPPPVYSPSSWSGDSGSSSSYSSCSASSTSSCSSSSSSCSSSSSSCSSSSCSSGSSCSSSSSCGG